MAKAEEILTQSILELLAQKPEGLEVEEVLQHLAAGDSGVSPRGVRNLLNRLVKEGKLDKRKKRQSKGRGKPPYAYFHPNNIPKQINIFENILGVDSNKSSVISRAEVEKPALDKQELQSQESAPLLLKALDFQKGKNQDKHRPVFERIAIRHWRDEAYAKAIIDIAPRLANENPVELLVGMARWVVNDINQLGDEIESKWQQGGTEEVKKLAARLDERLTRARDYFQRFWRLDRSVDEISGILDLPGQAKHFFRDGRRAQLNEEAARERLKKRILGERLIEEQVLPVNQHKAAVGTDASIAKIFLAHSSGSFIPPDPVIVTTSAAAMAVDDNNPRRPEYQDFDIFPDRLQEYENYEDYNAAQNGLVLSPEIMRLLGAESFKRSQIAAMELRQYNQDFRVSTRSTKWRPIGDVPELGINPKPTLIFRDGRVFPVVHRINFYEADNLYGQIVRNQIAKFADVIHYTLSSPMGEIVYAAAVKNPELSWLAPLVFWYLHINKVEFEGRLVVDGDDVYKVLFADTAVSHLLFLGVAKQSGNFEQQRHFVTCRVVRRFSDIAFVDTSLPVVISENSHLKLVEEENNIDDWYTFISQRIAKKQENHEENVLDEESDYAPFIYICHKVGVLMCYAAPTSAYEVIVSGHSGGAGHFLIPRLEVAINLEQKPSSYQKSLDKMLSWLAAGHWELDFGHTQSGFDTGEGQNNYPVLVPDVIRYADEAARFARDKLSNEIEDEIRSLITKVAKSMVFGF